METNIFEQPVYKRSRLGYIIFSLVEYLGSILIADAFLAKLLTNVGISDSLTGIISTFISLGGVFQILSIVVARAKLSPKAISIAGHVGSLTFFMLEYLVPFLPISQAAKTVLFVTFILLGYGLKNLMMNIFVKWSNSFVEPIKRGSFSATMEMISLIGGMVFSYAMGAIVDHFEAVNMLNTAFILCAVMIFIMNVTGFISILMVRSKPHYAENETPNVNNTWRDILNNTFKNKSYVNVLISLSLWNMSRFMLVGFLGTFKIKELGISVGTVQIMAIIAIAARMIVSKPFGKYSDKHTFASGMKLGYFIELLSYIAVIAVRPAWWWLIGAQIVLYYIGLAGTNANSTNIIYSYVDTKYFVEANAIKTAICGLAGFLIAILGGKIVTYVQNSGDMLFGIHIYGQQVIAIISLFIMIINIAFVHFVIEKQRVKIQ